MDRLAQLNTFLKESPDDPFLLYAIAQEYISKGEDDKAEINFKTLLDNHPNYIATYYHYGKLKERANRKEEAMELYRMGIDKAKSVKEQHSLSELQSALLELEYE
jgi:tetratricopeptide (TPR) repeat protein